MAWTISSLLLGSLIPLLLPLSHPTTSCRNLHSPPHQICHAPISHLHQCRQRHPLSRSLSSSHRNMKESKTTAKESKTTTPISPLLLSQTMHIANPIQSSPKILRRR